MKDFIEKMITAMFGTSFMGDAMNVLQKLPSDFTDAWSIVTACYNVVLPIGVSLMCIYFLVALVDKITSEQFNIEVLMKLLFKLIIAKFFVDHGLEIFNLLMDVGKAFITEFTGYTTLTAVNGAVDAMKAAAMRETNSYSLFPSLLFVVKMMIPFLAIFIVQIIISFVCYSRLLEMMVRIVAAPLAVSDIFANGINSSGYRYMKNFLAICLQSGIIFLISVLFNAIQASIVITPGATTDFLDFSIMYLTLAFSCTALITKSLSFTKEIVGTA